MDKEIIETLYRALWNNGIVSCSATYNGMERSYDLTIVEGRVMSNIYMVFTASGVNISVCQSAPRYPVYDIYGNVKYYGI